MKTVAMVTAAYETRQCGNCPSALPRCCERARTRASSSRMLVHVPAQHAGTDPSAVIRPARQGMEACLLLAHRLRHRALSAPRR